MVNNYTLPGRVDISASTDNSSKALFCLLHKLTQLQQHRTEVTVIYALWFYSKELHGFHTNTQVEIMYFISYEHHGTFWMLISQE